MKTRLFSTFLTLLLVSTVYPLPSFAQDYTQWHLPEGAKMRLGKGTINEIAYSPDGTRLAAATSMGIWLYDAHSGEEVNLFTGGTTIIPVFSPDWKTLAIPDRSEVDLRDVETGAQKHTLAGHSDWVNSVSFSPDGKTLASAVSSNKIRLWDVETGTHKHTLTGHTLSINSMSFSPDGKTLASGSWDLTIRLWNVQTGKHKYTITEHVEGGENVLFSPDGGTLASGERSSDTIHLWDVDTGVHKHAFTAHMDQVYSISFSPDGKTLAIPNGKEVNLWDTETGELKRTLTGHPGQVDSVSYNLDGTLATGSWKEIRLWDAETSVLKRTLEWFTELGYMSGVLTPSDVYSMSFGPNGSTLAIGSRTEIRVWNVSTGEEKYTLTGHMEEVYGVSFSPDGKSLVAGSGVADRVWDIETGTEKPAHTAHQRDNFRGLLSPDGETRAIVNGNEIYLRDVETGERKHTLTGHTAEINSVVFSPDGRTLASGGGWADETIRVWNVETGELKHEITGLTGDYIGVRFHSDSRTLASWGRGETFYLWNAETGELKHEFTGHTRQVNGVSFSSDGTTLASGSSDGTVLVWNLAFPSIEPEKPAEDINGDGVVNILDLVRVASDLGESGENGTDVNGDGIVNILDLVLVAGALGNVAAAPSLRLQVSELLTATDVQQWLTQAHRLDLTDATVQRGVLFLEQLLAILTPKETTLLPNYPNPFNPETWIPYRLAEDSNVTLTIHALNGQPVRRLKLGHQTAGTYYSRSRAAYWDGKNDFGEPVASGVYFYHLSAGDYSATRKMLILK